MGGGALGAQPGGGRLGTPPHTLGGGGGGVYMEGGGGVWKKSPYGRPPKLKGERRLAAGREARAFEGGAEYSLHVVVGVLSAAARQDLVRVRSSVRGHHLREEDERG